MTRTRPLLALIILAAASGHGADNAAFATQDVPRGLGPGRAYPVVVHMTNTGDSTWTQGAGFNLGSANPNDNQVWGTSRVPLAAEVPPGGVGVFSFSITAPTTPPPWNFQWQMVHDGVGWFGAPSTNLALVSEVSIALAPDPALPRVAFHYDGFHYDPALHRVTGIAADGMTAVMPACGAEVKLRLTVASAGADRVVRIAATITDFVGEKVADIAMDVTAPDGVAQVAPIAFTPSEAHRGPFAVSGTWSEVGGGATGVIDLALGQANRQVVVQDFELVSAPDAGAALETAPAGAHRGDGGLIARLPPAAVVKDAPADAPAAKSVLEVPLDRWLPGRPVALAVWLKPDADVTLSLRVMDPGIEAQQRRNPDAWTVGPVAVAAGDWRRVELPMPGFGRAKARLNPHGEGDGVIDYPLNAQWLKIEGPGGTTVLIDDVTVMTQGEAQEAIATRLVVTKPIGLLYHDDAIGLAVANTWLWGASRAFTYRAELIDVAGVARPLGAGAIELAPGEEQVQRLAFTGLPSGGWQVRARIDTAPAAGDAPVAEAPANAFTVYQPTGAALAPRALRDHLRSREHVLADLGFGDDVLLFQWHATVDGGTCVEPQQGCWSFDAFAAPMQARADAGLAVIGKLGFTPIYADPGANFNRKSNAWLGGNLVMPSQTIYWEEYVRRTVAAFAGRVGTWVVWDRPDSSQFQATPEEFASRMLEVAHDAAVASDPNAKLVSGAVAKENIEDYIQALAEVGVDRYLQGIGCYPTDAPLSPEDSYLDVTLARAQAIRAREHIVPELWVMNLGWPTGPERERVDEDTQARYVARAYAICRALGIAHILLQPDGTEGDAKRDSADLIFPAGGGLWGIKPAALSAKTARAMLAGAAPVREVFLDDRVSGLARAYLFQRGDGRLVLAAWRREGASELALTIAPESVVDLYGNAIAATDRLQLTPEPRWAVFAAQPVDTLVKALERASVAYEDAPESAWKRAFDFRLDVGDAADEAAAGYVAERSQAIGPIDSWYHNEHGRHLIDAGRRLPGAESFAVDVHAYGGADLILRKRIDYATRDQLVEVFCDDQAVGQWFAFKTDPRYRWRDLEFVVPNRFFAGKPTANLRFVPKPGTQVTSFAYAGAPLATKALWISDLSPLANVSGHYAAEALRDRNVLGGPLRFRVDPDGAPGAVRTKGFGTHSGDEHNPSIIVLCLNKQYARFKATVGVDEAFGASGEAQGGTVRFKVMDQNRTLMFDSQEMSYYAKPIDIDIDVSDSVVLLLGVDDCGDPLNDFADWADARLELK